MHELALVKGWLSIIAEIASTHLNATRCHITIGLIQELHNNYFLTLQATKLAIIGALSDASSSVFLDWCPKATVKINTLVSIVGDMVNKIYDSFSTECARSSASSKVGKTVNAKDVVRKVITKWNPLHSALSDALVKANTCGCKPSVCAWCNPVTSSNGTNYLTFGTTSTNKAG